jgi:hypothetical protein
VLLPEYPLCYHMRQKSKLHERRRRTVKTNEYYRSHCSIVPDTHPDTMSESSAILKKVISTHRNVMIYK